MQQILDQITAEVNRAKAKHPNWPSDTIHAAAIVCEESGELIRAALQHKYEGGSIEEMRKEAIQTAATCIRFLEHVKFMYGEQEPIKAFYFSTSNFSGFWKNTEAICVYAYTWFDAVTAIEKAYGKVWATVKDESAFNINHYPGGIIATINTITDEQHQF